MKLITAILARNEAGQDRYLRRVLTVCQQWSDTVCLLEDGSSDETPKLAAEAGCLVKHREHQPQAWGNEASARQELWQFALTQVQGPNDWVLWCDADMVLHGDPRPLMGTKEGNAWAWPLFDLWSDTEYRSDEIWRGHDVPRVWMVAPHRVPPGWVAEWDRQGLHVGHVPPNMPLAPLLAPPDVYWLHLAYATPALRRQKHRQYLSRAELLTPHERRHAESILDA